MLSVGSLLDLFAASSSDLIWILQNYLSSKAVCVN